MSTSVMRLPFMTAVLALVVGSILVGCGKTTTTDEAGRELTIVSPADQTIVQGSTNKVLITITRTNFNERVEIDVDDLPSGVDLADGNRAVPVDDNIVSVTLVADQDAKIVKGHLVKVTATGPGGLEVSEFFKLTVVPKE